jgi:crossover junction endodeoxyribonuclease RuvC
VVLLAASLTGLSIYEYSALEVKKAVVGYGRADKNQVQKMVKQILGLNRVLSSDSADALALTICHVNSKQHAVY